MTFIKVTVVRQNVGNFSVSTLFGFVTTTKFGSITGFGPRQAAPRAGRPERPPAPRSAREARWRGEGADRLDCHYVNRRDRQM